MFRIRHGVLILIVTALATAGCGGGDTSDDTGAPSVTEAPPAPAVTTGAPDATGAPAGQPDPAAAPETLAFQARTVDGGELDATTLAGQPVAFWFWAAWCPRCAAAADEVKTIQSEYAGQVHVVGVAGLGSGEDGMRDFVAQHGLESFPHLADDDGEVWRRFGVTTQEYFVVLDASGEIVHQGALSPQALRDHLTSLAS